MVSQELGHLRGFTEIGWSATQSDNMSKSVLIPKASLF